MPKTVEQELSESDRMHDLAVKFRKQKDTVSADALDRKVQTKRRKAIARLGKKVKRGTPASVGSTVIVPKGRTNLLKAS